jgi:hypothetical protein
LIKNIFPKEEKVPQANIDLLIEKMISPLLKLFDDKIEKIRQMAIDLVFKLMSNYKLEEKVVSLIINTMISRLNSIPFPETCMRELIFIKFYFFKLFIFYTNF